MAKLGSVSVELEADATSLNKTLREVNSKLAGLSKEAKKTGGGFGSFAQEIAGAVGGMAAFAIATRTATASLMRFAELESAIVRVGAVSGATASEMKAIEAAASSLGSSTVFSSKEAAEGMQFLAMAGLDASKTIGAMPAVLQLAQAAAVDLGTSADVVTNIMAGFGKEANELAKVNDALVATFTGSNVTLTELGEAFKVAGPVAKTLGIEFDELAAAIGVLGNAGIKGSLAGTGLKRALTALINASPKSRKAMNVLGLSSDDASRGFENLTKKLEVARGELSQKVFTGKLFEAFGERAGPILAALVEQGSSAIGKLNKRIAGSDGLAASIQKAELATTTGQFKLMTSAIDGLAVEIGSQLAPAAQLAFLNLRKMANVAKAAISDQTFVAGSEDLAKATNRREALLASIKAVKSAVAGGFGSPADAFERVNEILAKTQGLAKGTDVRAMFGIKDTARAGEILAGLNRALGETHKALGRNADGSERVATKLKIASAETKGLGDGTKKTTSELEDMAEAAKKVADELARAAEEMANNLAGSMLAPGRVSGGGGGGTGLGFGSSGELAGRQSVQFAPEASGTTITERFRPENLPTETTDAGADAFAASLKALSDATAELTERMRSASESSLDEAIRSARVQMDALAESSNNLGSETDEVKAATKATKAAIVDELAERINATQGASAFRLAMFQVEAAAKELGISFDDVAKKVKRGPDTGTADNIAGLLTNGVNFGDILGKGFGAAAPAIGAAAGGPIGSSIASAVGGFLKTAFEGIAEGLGSVFGRATDLAVDDPVVAGAVGAFKEAFVPLSGVLLPLAAAMALLSPLILASAFGFALVATVLAPVVLVLSGFLAVLFVLNVIVVAAIAAIMALIAVVVAVIGAIFTFIAGVISMTLFALAAATGLVWLAGAVFQAVAAIILLPAIIAGLAGAFLFLLGQTETFGKITKAIGGVVATLIIPQMEMFAGKLVFLVGLFEAVAVVFRTILMSFGGGDGDAVARFLFFALKNLAVISLEVVSTSLKINNALLTFGETLLGVGAAIAQGMASILGRFAPDSLTNFAAGLTTASAALGAMRVDTDSMDAAIDALSGKTFEDVSERGTTLIDALAELEDGVGDAADTFSAMNEAGSNLPQFFRRAAIASGAEVPGLSGAPSTGGGLVGGGQVLTPLQITVQIERVVTDNPLDLLGQIADIGEREAFRSTGVPIRTAAGGTNGG